MKVSDHHPVRQVLPHEPVKARKTGGKKFDNLLQENMQAVGAAKAKPSKAAGAHFIAPLTPPAFDREEVVGRLVRFLDIMDDYAQKLGNPRVTLKEISPLIAKIEAEKDQLKLLSETLPPFDEMRTLLDETLIRSSVEIIKYNRGDYIET